MQITGIMIQFYRLTHFKEIVAVLVYLLSSVVMSMIALTSNLHDVCRRDSLVLSLYALYTY
jgi:hypothetical protein